MRRNPELEAALDELSKHGVTEVTRSGRKHIKLRFDWNGEDKLIVLAGTSGDTVRGPRHARAHVRQALGVTAARPKSTRPRKKRNKAEPPHPIPAITCGKDPWAPYRAELEDQQACMTQFGQSLGVKVYWAGVRIRRAGKEAAQRIEGYAR